MVLKKDGHFVIDGLNRLILLVVFMQDIQKQYIHLRLSTKA